MGTTRGQAGPAAAAADALRARRRMLQAILACALGAPSLSAAQVTPRASRVPDEPRPRPVGAGHDANLPAAQDLAADAARAARERIPLLLFFDRWDCPYCERALREYLVPMARDEDSRDRVVYRQVEVDGADALIDFAGASSTHHALAQRYRVRFTPTVLLVDAAGQPLGDPLVGFVSPDFYGAYLEAAIDAATARIRGEARSGR